MAPRIQLPFPQFTPELTAKTAIRPRKEKDRKVVQLELNKVESGHSLTDKSHQATEDKRMMARRQMATQLPDPGRSGR